MSHDLAETKDLLMMMILDISYIYIQPQTVFDVIISSINFKGKIKILYLAIMSYSGTLNNSTFAVFILR